MSVTGLWPWLVLFGLGAFHGLNPGMGWLFAVGLGLQERRRGAVLAALLPIALGHALSIAAVLAVLWVARESLPAGVLRGVAAAVLFGFGLYRLLRTRHPGGEGMRVGIRHLTAWSFLMASAHGAGLMLVPLLLGGQAAHAGHAMPMPAAPFATPLAWLGAVAVHTVGHLLVAALVALLVYEKLGLSLLRRAAFNLDLLWGIALIVCGVVILLL